MGKKRQHPLQMLPFIGKYLFLLLLPLARGLAAVRDPAGLETWVRGSWFDILILLCILLFSFLSWRCSSIEVRDRCLILHNGLFVHKEAVIPLSHITTLSVETPFYLRPFDARRVFVDTAGGSMYNADFTLLLHTQDAKALLSLRLPQQPVPAQRRYRAKWRYLVFLSLCVSDSLTGILLAATLFQRSGKILGAEFQQQVLGGLDTLASPLWFLPHTAAVIALLLVIGWLIAFIRNLMHYVGFSVTRYTDMLHIHTGFLNKRHYTCPVDAINFMDFRQTVLGKILGLYVVFIHCVGYGKRKEDKAVLIPAASTETTRRITEKLLWELPRTQTAVHPAAYALWRYVRWPLITLLMIPLGAYLLIPLVPDWADLLSFVAVMACIPTVWRLLLSILDRHTAGIGANSSSLTLRYGSGFTLHTVVIPRSRVSFIRIRQSFFQKRRGICDVFVYTYNEHRTAHRVRQLPLNSIQKLLDI